MGSNWYALRTKPNREALAWHQAQLRGAETYYPHLNIRPVNPRSRKNRPYFPGYLFVRADLEAVGMSTFQYMPYALGLVCFGGEPAPVADAVIRTLQRRLGELGEGDEFWHSGPKKNDRVWIHDGPFAGYGGIFDTRLPGGERVRLLLDMLNGRCVPIELDAAQIEYSQLA